MSVEQKNANKDVIKISDRVKSLSKLREEQEIHPLVVFMTIILIIQVYFMVFN